MPRTGGCACGALRYRIAGEPVRVSVCHCKECQRRTGSAFGISCIFAEEDFDLLQGSPKSYNRQGESGRGIEMFFCPVCASTVYWKVEAFKGAIGIAGGCFDDTGWLDPKLHIWAKSAQNWVVFPDHAEVLEESNIGKNP